MSLCWTAAGNDSDAGLGPTGVDFDADTADTMKVGSSDPIETLFSAMVTAIVTGATLVVTIGQLVLAQENGPLGDQRERMNESMDVREPVSELTGSPSPADPAAFLDVSYLLRILTLAKRTLAIEPLVLRDSE